MIKNSEIIDKLRISGLRPTKQRLKICEVLFKRDKTFHFTINDLAKSIGENVSGKISLATVYNTVHAFKKNGYLKEIVIATDKSYFDTNTGTHSHFFDIKNKEISNLLNVQYQTTLLIFKNNKEVYRSIGETSKDLIYKAIQSSI